MNEHTTPNVDVPKLRKVVEWARVQDALEQRGKDSEWYQSSWVSHAHENICENPACWDCEEARKRARCGTRYCLAGYVAHLDGVMETFQLQRGAQVLTLESEYTKDGEHVSGYAARALGLEDARCMCDVPYTQCQDGCRETGVEVSHRLFQGYNVLEDVENIASDLAGERL